MIGSKSAADGLTVASDKLALFPESDRWLAFWADDPNGPLSISPDGGNTELALFQRPCAVPPAQRATIAFRVGGAGFQAFLARLAEHPVYDREGQQVTAQDIVDHDKSFSVYFCDPDGNPYELTTYDYAEVAAKQ